MNAGRLLLFGCGQLGMMGLARFFFSYVLDFSSRPDAAGVPLYSASLVGLALLGFRLFDGITDPVAGISSDGWVRKGKERRKLLWFSFLVPSLGLFLCFAATHQMAPGLRWTLLLSGMLVFFAGYTFYAIPYWSLISDYAPGSAQGRRVLSNALGAGLLLATAVGAVVAPSVIAHLGYQGAALAFAVPAGLLMILPYYARPRHAARAAKVEEGPKGEPLLRALTLSLRHRRFLAVLVLFAGSQMAFTIVTAAAPFIARDLLGGTLADVPKILGPFLATAIPFFIVVPWLSRKLGWERAVMLSSLLLGVVYALAGTLGTAVVGTPMQTAMLVFALGGPMAAVLLGLEGEAITACATERADLGEATSIYFGVYNFVVKTFNGVAIAFSGWMVERSLNPAHGPGSIRAMSIVAGGLLCAGMVGYFLLSRRLAPASAVPTSALPPS